MTKWIQIYISEAVKTNEKRGLGWPVKYSIWYEFRVTGSHDLIIISISWEVGVILGGKKHLY